MVEALGQDGLCRQPAAEIAQAAGLTQRAVEKTLAALVKDCVLCRAEKGGGRGKASAYRIEMPGLANGNTERHSENKRKNTELGSENPEINPDYRSEFQENTEPNSVFPEKNTEPHSENTETNTEPRSEIPQNSEPDSENGPQNTGPRSEFSDAYKELTCLPTNQQGDDSGRQVGGARAETDQPADQLAIAAFEQIFGRETGIYEQDLITAKVQAGNLAAWRVFLSEYKRDYPKAKNLVKVLAFFEQRQAEIQRLIAANAYSGSSVIVPVQGVSDAPVRRETKNTAGNGAVFDAWEQRMKRKLEENHVPK